MVTTSDRYSITIQLVAISKYEISLIIFSIHFLFSNLLKLEFSFLIFIYRPLTPEITATPSSLNFEIETGSSSTAVVTLNNIGLIESGDLIINLPVNPYLSLISSTIVPSINAGDSYSFSISLSSNSNSTIGNHGFHYFY